MHIKASFANDYSEGCHPSILAALSENNLVQQSGYGQDAYSIKAKQLIKQQLNHDSAAIHLIVGGTLLNLIALSSVLRNHEAVIAPDTGHIAQHETGAIEATGHKVITVPSCDGKLTVDDIDSVLLSHALGPHMVKPRVVYISHATELGTVYSKSELTTISDYCREHQLYLFVDGARLGMALYSERSDLTLADMAQLTDMFWIGGTKVGALCGDALVINHPDLQQDFDYMLKQRGGMLAKGRLLGTQFCCLFEGNLYRELAINSNTAAKQLSQGIVDKGYRLSVPTETNQVFAILPNPLVDELAQQFMFYRWESYDEAHTVIRLVTSWATDVVHIRQFIDVL